MNYAPTEKIAKSLKTIQKEKGLVCTQP